MPAAVAIPAVLGAVGVGSSIFSGITGSSAASKAAAVQKAAADQAGQQVTSSAAAVNPLITQAAATAGDNAVKAAGDAGAGVTSATDRANNLLDPYRLAGYDANATLQDGLVAGGDFNKTPTAKDILLDPAFAGRLDYADTAQTRAAAARGGVSGTALMDLAKFNQSQYSDEFERAFERYRTTTQDRFNNLNTVATRGTQVSDTEGKNLISAGTYSGDAIQKAAQYQGDKNYGASVNTGDRTYDASKTSADYETQGANAEAGGIIGKQNAINSAIGSGVNALTGAAGVYAQLNPLKAATTLQPPATAPKIPGVTVRAASTNPGLVLNNLRRAA